MARRPRYTEEEARVAVAASRSYAEALRRLGMRSAGGNWLTLKKYAITWGLSIEHFDPHAARSVGLGRKRTPLEAILVEGSSYARRHLKRRLYEEGLKARCCELCGQGEEWRGNRMSLILDHVNGVGNDNRLENLRIVCPNCAATLDTHCGRNVRPHRLCARCASPFFPSHREQRHCSRACSASSPRRRAAGLAQRRVERPTEAQLRAEIAELGFLAVGRRYGVTDNAIRKWLRAYERERADG